MMASRIRGAFCFAIAVGAVACESVGCRRPADRLPPLTVVSGNGQVGSRRADVVVPLAVKVVSAAGAAFKGAVVKFVGDNGNGDGFADVHDDGLARARRRRRSTLGARRPAT